MIRRYIVPAFLIAGLTMTISACSTAAPSEVPKEPVATSVGSAIQSPPADPQNVPQATETSPQSNTSVPQSNPEVQEEKKEAIPEKRISKSAGLGDTLKVFEEDYGTKTGDGPMVCFKDGYICPLTIGERVDNVTMSFESTGTPRRTKDEALELVSDIVPADAKKIKRWKVDEGRDAILYTSKSLAEVFRKEEFGSAKPGTFIVLLKYDTQGVYAAIAGTGDQP